MAASMLFRPCLGAVAAEPEPEEGLERAAVGTMAGGKAQGVGPARVSGHAAHAAAHARRSGCGRGFVLACPRAPRGGGWTNGGSDPNLGYRSSERLLFANRERRLHPSGPGGPVCHVHRARPCEERRACGAVLPPHPLRPRQERAYTSARTGRPCSASDWRSSSTASIPPQLLACQQQRQHLPWRRRLLLSKGDEKRRKNVRAPVPGDLLLGACAVQSEGVDPLLRAGAWSSEPA